MREALSVPPESPTAGRLLSLDAFRGATVAAMILVNNPGDWSAVYGPLRHAAWHGWTFTDTVFPFFLWIVGLAIPLSVTRRLQRGQSRRELFLHALRRAVILFGLGLLLAVFSECVDGSLFRKGLSGWLRDVLLNVRVPGVLQRIAVCYLAAFTLFLTMRVRGLAAWCGGLLLGYWALMALVPFPVEVDGQTRWVAGMYEKGANLAGYVDNLVFNGPVIGRHVWAAAGTWDPEGLLSTLPAVATCLLGTLAGLLMGSSRPAADRTAWLMVGGVLLMGLGQVWSLVLPINKSLWTSSYAVFMAGLAAVCFGVCYWLVDVQGWRRWALPAAVYGRNAITMFVLAGLLGRLSLAVKIGPSGSAVSLKTWLYQRLCAPLGHPDAAPWLGSLARPENASLLWALLYVGLLYLLAWGMHRKGWIVKI